MRLDHGVHIIAEAGTNNNGDLQKAKDLAKIAKAAGADSVKFQIINTWGLYLPGKYEYGKYDIEEVIRLRREGQMSDEEYRELARYCSGIGMPLAASVFDKQGLDLLIDLNPPYVKLASCDLNHYSFVRQVAARGKRMVLSTGMSDFADVERVMNELGRINFNDVVLMHCVSSYPTALENSNLGYIQKLKANFDVPIGFSDHTEGNTASCVALSLGATWFEKHFTEDRKQAGLDHAYALEPDQLTSYVADLRAVEKALSNQDKVLGVEELNTRRRARRSLYAARNLRRGDILKEADVLVVRPEGEMQAGDIDLIVGKPLLNPVNQYQAFSYRDFEL